VIVAQHLDRRIDRAPSSACPQAMPSPWWPAALRRWGPGGASCPPRAPSAPTG
jgi:hypothetical protein